MLRLWRFGTFSFSPQSTLAPFQVHLGTRAPGRRQNSPRLGLLSLFPVDEVALHLQHHITCSILHPPRIRDGLQHTFKLFMITGRPTNGESLASGTARSLPCVPRARHASTVLLSTQTSQTHRPNQPFPLMQVMTSLACQIPSRLGASMSVTAKFKPKSMVVVIPARHLGRGPMPAAAPSPPAPSSRASKKLLSKCLCCYCFFVNRHGNSTTMS